MSRLTLRAAAGLVLALALAAFAAPPKGDDDADTRTVRMAAVSAPVIVDTIDSVAVPSAGEVIDRLGQEIAADVAVAQEDAALEYIAAVEEARKAEEARRAEAARIAAEQARVAAAPGSIDAIIQRHFGAAAPTARRIAVCESNLNPRAVSPTNDHGLFQINAVHRGQFESVTGAPWSAVYDPEVNTRYARWLYGQQGWGPWSCA